MCVNVASAESEANNSCTASHDRCWYWCGLQDWFCRHQPHTGRCLHNQCCKTVSPVNPVTYQASLHLTKKLLRGLPFADACLSKSCLAVSLGTSCTDACSCCGAGMAGSTSLPSALTACRKGAGGSGVVLLCWPFWNLARAVLRACCCCDRQVYKQAGAAGPLLCEQRDVLVVCMLNVIQSVALALQHFSSCWQHPISIKPTCMLS